MDFNSQNYRPSISERNRNDESYRIFTLRVLTVDFERKVLTAMDTNSGVVYSEINKFPANSSSFEATDVCMPEPGAFALACRLYFIGGHSEIAILQWMVHDTERAIDAVAMRPINDVEGHNKRQRGVYRKAWPGQRTVTTTNGYSEKTDEGWDRVSVDFSRDKLDPYRSTWTQSSSRRVEHTDAGVKITGVVNRTDADNIEKRLLPDGGTEQVLYLSSRPLNERYTKNEKDILPIVECLEKYQEFGLDYPVPVEILDSDLFHEVLGTTQSLWGRTEVKKTGKVEHDDQTYLIDQEWDHPYDIQKKPVGPTLKEGVTPRRRGFILERSTGTLVGSNRFDKSNYGKVLKPVVFPHTLKGRFSTDVSSGYLPVNDSVDHVETRLASSMLSVRCPHEYNTTRWDITKEGLITFEIGSTLPKENIKFEGGYEHPHGAGRSMEGHLTGSLKMVIGKNRDEEEAIDLQALGQMVLRLGADDCSLPDQNRSILTQNRSKSDILEKRELQFWGTSKLTPGDAGSLDATAKVGGENVSLRAAFDGGTFLRLGARSEQAKRRHLKNGYTTGTGETRWPINSEAREDSKKSGRPTYGSGDSVYAFHDLTLAGKPQTTVKSPYMWSGPAMKSMDTHGLSLDVHAVRDVLVRAGKNPESGQSLLMDLAGGLVACLGKDGKGRSLTATLDGGVEMTIGSNSGGRGLALEIDGDVDWVVRGNFHMNVTGDTVWESHHHQHIAKGTFITKATKILSKALTQHTCESPEIVNNQGTYKSTV